MKNKNNANNINVIANPKHRHKDKVYANIKADIIRCVLKPGEAISEAKLASNYNVGKAPIRDALSRLCHENLIISQPRKGHIITPITIRDVIDTFEVRMCLEPMAARMAAGKVDEELLLRAANACETPIAKTVSGNISKFLSSNTELHCLIAQYSGNQRLTKQISSLLEDAERVRYIIAGSVTSRPESIADHAKLVEALIDGNGEEAARISKRHIQHGWRLIMGSLLSKFEFMDHNLGNLTDDHQPFNLFHQDFSVSNLANISGDSIFKLVNNFDDNETSPDLENNEDDFKN